MKITAQEEYGLRCVVAVARAIATKKPLAISEIAKTEGLSTQYVAKLMNVLKRQDLVTSTRGLCGGFTLAKPATQISVIEVLRALGGGFDMNSEHICSHFPGKKPSCVHLGSCSVRPMWMIIQRHITDFLQHLTLQDLLNEETAAAARMEQFMREIADNDRALQGASTAKRERSLGAR